MAVTAIVGLCVLGACLIGGGVCIGAHYYDTPEEKLQKLRENEAEIQNKIETKSVALQVLNEMQSGVKNAKSELKCANDDFQNGGHTYDGVALYKDRNEDIRKDLESAYNSLNGIVNTLNTDIKDLKNQLADVQRQIREVQAEIGG